MGDAPLSRSLSSIMVQEAASWFSICSLFVVLLRRRSTHGVICDGGYGYVDMMDMDVM